MLSDFERFLLYLGEVDENFTRWKHQNAQKIRYASTILSDFSIDELTLAVDELYGSAEMPVQWRTRFLWIRNRCFVNRRPRPSKDEFCTVCGNERLVSVVSPGSIANIAEGQRDFVRTTSLKCACRAQTNTYQRARSEMRCIVEIEDVLDEAVGREIDMSRAENCTDTGPFNLNDLAMLRCVFDWITAHRIARRVQGFESSGSFELDYQRAVRELPDLYFWPDSKLRPKVERFLHDQKRFSAEQSSAVLGKGQQSSEGPEPSEVEGVTDDSLDQIANPQELPFGGKGGADEQ